MNTAICSPTEGSVGIGFAIGTEELSRIIPRLLHASKTTTPAKLHSLNLGVKIKRGKKGVVLTQVNPGSRASKAGLLAKDIILEIAGYPIRDQKSFNWASDEVGDSFPVSLKVVQNGLEKIITIYN
jgi:S1-C subfamily serine protease